MTDVKRLLAEATPRPWHSWRSRYVNGSADAALAVYAVNHLPDYLAAVEALEALAELAGPETNEPEWSGNWRVAWRYAREALARLRDEVPA